MALPDIDERHHEAVRRVTEQMDRTGLKWGHILRWLRTQPSTRKQQKLEAIDERIAQLQKKREKFEQEPDDSEAG